MDSFGDLLLIDDLRNEILGHLDFMSMNHLARTCKALTVPCRVLQDSHVHTVDDLIRALHDKALRTREWMEIVLTKQYAIWWWCKGDIAKAYPDFVMPIRRLHLVLRVHRGCPRYLSSELIMALMQYVLNLTHDDLYYRAKKILLMNRLVDEALATDKWLHLERYDARAEWKFAYSQRLQSIHFDSMVNLECQHELYIPTEIELRTFVWLVENADTLTTLPAMVGHLRKHLVEPWQAFEASRTEFVQAKAHARAEARRLLGRDLACLRRFGFRRLDPIPSLNILWGDKYNGS